MSLRTRTRTRFRNATLAGALALLPGAGASALAQDEAKAEAEARTSAQAWLALLDDQQYAETWAQAGAILQGAVSQDEWTRKLSVTLGPLGKVKSRSVRSTEYSTTMPGVPDGEYVVVIYDTEFQKKQTAVETVPLMKEDDGMWRVSGYWIR